MSNQTRQLATKFFWTFALTTFFGTLAIGFYGVGIAWLMIATPFLARWQTLARQDEVPGVWWPPPLRLVSTFLLMLCVGVSALVTGGITFFVTCLVGMNSESQRGPVYGPSEQVMLFSGLIGLAAIVSVIAVATSLIAKKFFRNNIEQVDSQTNDSD